MSHNVSPGNLESICLPRLVLHSDSVLILIYTTLDRATASDQLLSFRLDMVDSGVTLIARHMAVEYGDGESIVSFWRDSQYIYNLQGKVLKTAN